MLTAMPRGLPVAGSRVAITPLPRLMPARSLPVGARSARAVAVGAGGADAHAAKKQRAASAAKRVIADFARSFVCHGLIEKKLHFAEQLHAVLFHYHRMRAFADHDEPLVWRGASFGNSACAIYGGVSESYSATTIRTSALSSSQDRTASCRRRKIACVLGRAVWRANDWRILPGAPRIVANVASAQALNQASGMRSAMFSGGTRTLCALSPAPP